MSDDLVPRLRRAVTWQGVVPHGNELAREAADEIERLRAENERLMEEITDGDYWHKRATQAIENGTCPICFSGDESGHKGGCLWGEVENRADQLEAEIERLRDWMQRVTDAVVDWRTKVTGTAGSGCPIDAVVMLAKQWLRDTANTEEENQ